MISISLLTIEGTFEPQRPQINCTIQAAHIQEQSPEFFLKESDFDLEKSIYLKENFKDYHDPEDPSFWKQRVFIQMVVCPHILSMAFIPYSGAKCQTLFMQKINVITKITGFVAPYLSAADQEIVGAVPTLPICYPVHDEASIHQSLIGLNHFSEEIGPILRDFLHDPDTAFLAITCLGDDKQLISRGWLKV